MMYPWLATQWLQWQQRLERKRVPHAIIIQGPDGVGKAMLARCIAKSALCLAETGQPCDSCNACHWFDASTHPDWRLLAPDDEAKSKQIKVDQVRELIAWMSLSSQGSAHRVALIEPADGLNEAAANSLLKTLEEPPENSLLILVTSKPHRLPVTIRSRCQALSVQTPDHQPAKHWLEQEAQGDAELALSLANGSPLIAKEYMMSDFMQNRDRMINGLIALTQGRATVVSQLHQWKEIEPKQLLSIMGSVLQDIIRLKQAPQAGVTNRDCVQALTEMANPLNLTAVYALLDHANTMYAYSDTTMNSEMMLEEMVVRWQAINQSL